jgi:hypothetical protein
VTIPVVCPSCSAKLKAPDRAAGGKLTCPKCDEPVPVPHPDRAGFTERGRGKAKLSNDALDDDDLPTPPSVSRSGVMVFIVGGIVAAVGLALTTGLLAWTLFRSAPTPPPPVAIGPTPAPAEPTRPVENPAAEPVYADATKGAVKVGDFEVLVLEVRYDKVATTNVLGEEGLTPQPQLIVRVGIRNKSPTKKLEFAGWAPGGGLAPGGLAGGVAIVPPNPNPATLKDDLGNAYRPAQLDPTTSVKDQQFRVSIYPAKNLADVLVFEAPVPKAQALLLDLPLKAVGGSDSVRFRIPTNRVNRNLYEQP